MADLMEQFKNLEIKSTITKPDYTTEITRDGEQLEWQRERHLGSGTFGDVWLEKETASGKLRAVKEVRKSNRGSFAHRKELQALSTLTTHPTCFVTFYGWFESPFARNSIFFAMEYVKLGDLSKIIQDTKATEEDAKSITSQVLHALSIMHEIGFAHRDLKPANILVAQRYPFWWVKLGDFGISKQVEGDDALETVIGTPAYRAPEISNYEPYTSACDMWSLGIVIYWVLTQSTPFSAREPMTQYNFLKDPTLFPTKDLNKNSVSAEGIDFIQRLIVTLPQDRMPISDAQHHPWLKDVHRPTNEIEWLASRVGSQPIIKPNDIVIAVIGATGTGKTSFVSHFTKDPLKIGHGMYSDTTNVVAYECQHNDTKLFLVDTPGFDDSILSDTQVLRELSEWLVATFSKDIRLTGIVYMHRIIDVRMSGSLLKNLRIFRKLCGQDMAGVALVSTMWDVVDPKKGESREDELIHDRNLWAPLVSAGALYARSDGTKEAARRIIGKLLERSAVGMTLDIQRELADGSKILEETAAGQELSKELNEVNIRLAKEESMLADELSRARAERDSVMIHLLQDELEYLKARRTRLLEDRTNLSVQVDAIRQRREKKFAQEWESLLEIMRRTEVSLVQNKSQLSRSEIDPETQLFLEQSLEKTSQRKIELEKKIEGYQENNCAIM